MQKYFTELNNELIMDKLNRYISFELLLALLIIIAFFLPWIDAGLVKVVGWDIPRTQKSVTKVTNFFSKNKESIYQTYAIFLVPAFSLLSMIFWIYMKQTISRVILFISGLFGFILSIYLFFNLPKIGNGVYLLCISSLISIIYLFFSFKSMKKVDNTEENIELLPKQDNVLEE